MDQHGDHEGSSQETIPEVQPEEVLVISLGTGPQITPGMMSENEVRENCHVSNVLKCTVSVFCNSSTTKLMLSSGSKSRMDIKVLASFC